jgi:LPXTG-motif cell wall-anchored protein
MSVLVGIGLVVAGSATVVGVRRRRARRP